jgi:hypothetical protein
VKVDDTDNTAVIDSYPMGASRLVGPSRQR